MNKTASTLCLGLALTLGANGMAHADHWRHRDGYGPPRYYQRDHDEGRHRHHGSNWMGPAAVLAITGLAIGAIVSSQAPRAVYGPPSAVVYPPENSGYWYYCGSAGQYYPYARHCPEGWQTVPPR